MKFNNKSYINIILIIFLVVSNISFVYSYNNFDSYNYFMNKYFTSNINSKFNNNFNSNPNLVFNPISNLKQNSAPVIDLTLKPEQCYTYPWENNLGNKIDEIKSLKDYSKKQGVDLIYANKVKEDNIMVCMACGCPRGYDINVGVTDKDYAKMVNLGFSKV